MTFFWNSCSQIGHIRVFADTSLPQSGHIFVGASPPSVLCAPSKLAVSSSPPCVMIDVPKSITIQSVLTVFGYSSGSSILRPLPIICTIVPFCEHGLVKITQDTGGASNPSVSTATFTITCKSPNSKSCSICARSSLSVSPVTKFALTPEFIKESQTCSACETVEQNTTVFLPDAFSVHSDTILSLMTCRSMIAATSSISYSLPRLVTLSSCSPTPRSITNDLGRTKNPSRIKVANSI